MKNRVPKITAFFVGAGCAAVALKGGWVAFTLLKPVRGLHFALGDVVGAHPKIFLLSYGFLVALLCGIGVLAFWLQRAKALTLTAFGILLLAGGAIFQVAFSDPVLLQDLLDDQQQYRDAETFARRNLPTNLGSEPTRRREISTGTIAGRLSATQYFMGPGWYAAIFAGLCGVVYGLREIPRPRPRWLLALGGGLAFLAQGVICLQRPVMAQRSLTRAIELESQGDLPKAVERYRRTVQLDPWYEIEPRVRQRIGAIDAASGRTNTLDYGIYQAEFQVQSGDLRSAIAILENLARHDDPMSPHLRKREAALWTLLGRDLYRAGATGDAALAWESALRNDQNQLLTSFLLSCAYFDLGRYGESVELIDALLTKCVDRVLLANFYSNQGDAYTKLGEFAKAHLAYQKSYKSDAVLNWRALTALVGGD